VTRNERVLLVVAIVFGGASLSLVAAEAAPLPVRLFLILALGGLATLDLVLFGGSGFPRWTVIATLLGLALANSTLPVAGIMNYGRFVPPVILFVSVVQSGAWQQGAGRTRGVMVAAGIAVLLVSASTLTSLDGSVTLEKSLAFVSVVAGVCAAVRWSVGHGRQLRDGVMIAFAVLVATNLVMLVIGLDSYSGFRFRGWTINPNNLGALCAFAAPVAAAEAMTSVGRRRLLALLLLGAAGVALFLTGSRSSSLAALLALAAVLRISQVARSLVFTGAMLASLILAPLAFRSVVDSELFNTAERQGGSGRNEVWPVAIDEIQKRPITGAGYATTEARFRDQEFGRFESFFGGQFHNSYLETAVELGVVGGLLMLGAGLFALWHLVRPIPPENAWAAGMAVSGAVIGIFETGLLTPGSVMMFPFWLAMGVLAVKAPRGPTEAAEVDEMAGASLA
jgi:exopolysaccharide production protein ExoQ